MRVWLHGLALLALIFVFAVSIVMLGSVIGSRSPWLAVLLMCDFLVVAKFAEPLIVLRMPRSLYRLRPWELGGDTLRRLGVIVPLPATAKLSCNAVIRTDGSRRRIVS